MSKESWEEYVEKTKKKAEKALERDKLWYQDFFSTDFMSQVSMLKRTPNYKSLVVAKDDEFDARLVSMIVDAVNFKELLLKGELNEKIF